MYSCLLNILDKVFHSVIWIFIFQLSKGFQSWGNWGLNVDFGKNPEKKLIRTLLLHENWLLDLKFVLKTFSDVCIENFELHLPFGDWHLSLCVQMRLHWLLVTIMITVFNLRTGQTLLRSFSTLNNINNCW